MRISNVNIKGFKFRRSVYNRVWYVRKVEYLLVVVIFIIFSCSISICVDSMCFFLYYIVNFKEFLSFVWV